MFVIRLG